MRGAALASFLVVVAAGCLDAHTTRCGDLLCPGDAVCVELAVLGPRCVRPEQEAACVGQPDGAICSVEGLFDDGFCAEGACFLPICGNGLRDPGEVCDDGDNDSGDGCSARCDSDESCGNGILDSAADEECDDGGIEPGDGCGPTCLRERCGNGVRDPGEVCDDNNDEPGDGCGPTCLSDETCGNGQVDFGIGEQCDDGNIRSHDGCSSACTAELPIFSPLAFPGALGTTLTRSAYDAANDRVVRFGGLGPAGEGLRLTESFAGEGWRSIRGPQPPARSGHVMVYDAGRRRVLVFGGEEPQPRMGPPMPPTLLDDRWELVGEQWQVRETDGPPALSGAAGAYDAARDQVVIFGGTDASGVTSATWVRDGEVWTQADPATPPPARTGHLLAYDSARERVVLFGGTDAADVQLNDTWEWDGSAWTETTPAVTPLARAGMAYDATRGLVLAFGGTFDEPNNELWAYDGMDWTPLVVPGEAPEPRAGMTFAFHARLGIVLSLGADGPMGPGFSATYVLDGSGWREIELALQPPARLFPVGDYDPFLRRVLFYGGRFPGMGATTLRDLWTYDGSWNREPVNDLMGPPFSAAVHDPTSGRTIAVRPGMPDLETWAFEDGRWFELATSGAPPSRGESVLVHDSARGVIVLFGGSDGGTNLGDTWELRGTTWTEVSSAGGPAPRRLALAAYDSERSRVVMTGGQGDGPMLQDTWEYDGTAWTELATTASPPPANGRGMVYHPARRSMVLVGRIRMAGGVERRQVWELREDEGAWGWSQVPTPVLPESRRGPLVVYLPESDSILFTNGDPQADTWELQWTSAVPDEVCGNGMDDDDDGSADCADPDCANKGCGMGQACIDGACTCRGGSTETRCGDGVDDDCDGVVDCADSDCSAAPLCTTETSCSDGVDEDEDGLVDCADPGCLGIGACEAYEVTCTGGLDEDGDGWVDCADPDCFLVACDALF